MEMAVWTISECFLKRLSFLLTGHVDNCLRLLVRPTVLSALTHQWVGLEVPCLRLSRWPCLHRACRLFVYCTGHPFSSSSSSITVDRRKLLIEECLYMWNLVTCLRLLNILLVAVWFMATVLNCEHLERYITAAQGGFAVLLLGIVKRKWGFECGKQFLSALNKTFYVCRAVRRRLPNVGETVVIWTP